LSPEGVFLVVVSGPSTWSVPVLAIVVGKVLEVNWENFVNFFDWSISGSFFSLLFTLLFLLLLCRWVFVALNESILLIILILIVMFWWVEVASFVFWILLLWFASLPFGLNFLISLFRYGFSLLDVVISFLWSRVRCICLLGVATCWWGWNISWFWCVWCSELGCWVNHLVYFNPHIWSHFFVGNIILISEGLWWESSWALSIHSCLSISSKRWKDIDVVTGKAMNLLVHFSFIDIYLFMRSLSV